MMVAASAHEEEGLRREAAFWERWLEGNIPDPEARALRLSYGRPFPWWAKPLVPVGASRLRVLDVGAGPVTTLGDAWGDRAITIVPVDPLAETYDRLLAKYGIVPPIRTIPGAGESLEEQFGRDCFDLAHASDSLDRAADPIECFRQMLAVLKPGCSLVTFHQANGGERHQYEPPHRWNFTVRQGRLIVWDPSVQRDVAALCQEAAHFRVATEGGVIQFTLTKRAAGSPTPPALPASA